MMEIGLNGTLVGQALWKLLLDLSNQGAIESNSHYIRFISCKKESRKGPTVMRTPGTLCITTQGLQRSRLQAVDGDRRLFDCNLQKLELP